MKIPFSLSKILKSTATTALLVSVTSCASTGSFFRQADSPLPVQTFDSTGGEMSNTRAYETSDRLYVAGGINKKLSPYSAAHVDVQLVAADGKIIAEKQDDLALSPRHPRLPRSRFCRPTYVASFPLSEARQTSKIVVKYHRVPHGS